MIENYLTKDESISLCKVSKSLFDELMKNNNIKRIYIKRKVFYDKNQMTEYAKELEYRRNLRVKEW